MGEPVGVGALLLLCGSQCREVCCKPPADDPRVPVAHNPRPAARCGRTAPQVGWACAAQVAAVWLVRQAAGTCGSLAWCRRRAPQRGLPPVAPRHLCRGPEARLPVLQHRIPLQGTWRRGRPPLPPLLAPQLPRSSSPHAINSTTHPSKHPPTSLHMTWCRSSRSRASWTP